MNKLIEQIQYQEKSRKPKTTIYIHTYMSVCVCVYTNKINKEEPT